MEQQDTMLMFVAEAETCHKCGKLGHFTNMRKTKNPNASSSKPQYQQPRSSNSNFKGKQYVNPATATEQESE